MSFDQIYSNYWQKVFRLCMGYVNDKAQAQDMAQETFITVWQQLPKFRNESAIGTWIFRIASNNCLRHLEKEKRMNRVAVPVSLPAETASDNEPRVQLLYRCIAELPELDRIVISLELEDVPQADIASITGISESNVRVRIHRIKQKLTQQFKQYESGN